MYDLSRNFLSQVDVDVLENPSNEITHDIFAIGSRPRRLKAFPEVDGFLSERVRSLKKSYSTYKGHLTRLYRELELAMSSPQNVDEVVEKKQSIEYVYGNLVRTYEMLLEMLSPVEQEVLSTKHVEEHQRRTKYLLNCSQWLMSVDQLSTR